MISILFANEKLMVPQVFMRTVLPTIFLVFKVAFFETRFGTFAGR